MDWLRSLQWERSSVPTYFCRFYFYNYNDHHNSRFCWCPCFCCFVHVSVASVLECFHSLRCTWVRVMLVAQKSQWSKQSKLIALTNQAQSAGGWGCGLGLCSTESSRDPGWLRLCNFQGSCKESNLKLNHIASTYIPWTSAQSLLTVPNCNGSWEMKSSCGPRRKENKCGEEPTSVCHKPMRHSHCSY